MKIGIMPPLSTPIASPAYLSVIGPALEERGFASVWAPEHVLLFDEYESKYPYTVDGRMGAGPTSGIHDPFAVLTYLAAVTNTWHLRNAVDYDFPTNLTLAAGARLLVVGFDPASNATQLASFRTNYNVPTNVMILGPWQGKLDNSGETIELKRPDKPDLTAGIVFVPYIMVDKVHYLDLPPWPTNADGLGLSLQRRLLTGFGNDPINWSASAPTAGRSNSVPNIPPVAHSQSLTNAKNTAFPITLTGTDPDGPVMNFVVVTNPVHGTWTVTPPNLTYTPASNYFGPDSLMFTVNDGSLTSAVATVSITITNVNDPPTAAPDTLTRSMSQGVTATAAALLANDSDVDGDTLSLISVTNPLPFGATVTLTNNLVNYWPPFGNTNAGNFNYILSDNHGGFATGLVSVVVVPDPAGSDVLGVTASPGTAVLVQLTGIPGFTYTLQFTDSLTPPNWQSLAVATANGDGVISFEDATSAGSTNRFYRAVRGIAP